LATTTDRSTGNHALPAIAIDKAIVLEGSINYATYNGGAGDIAMLIPVPAGTLVDKVIAIVDTVEGGTLTFDVGTFDADKAALDADGFLDGKDGNADASYISDGDLVAGYLFLVDGYSGITNVNAADAAEIKVCAMAWNVAIPIA